ncbi:CoA transferase [Megasphaera paucivorans]|uniref:Crotonobetainyl-CoA:carnitine CoA-transferase CaiB n=1 Tax=Megasphaera paucivorans TaxID=349095 RepID=A0A1G9Q6P6_9FIRM|nr:CoA transferase [Megasphaera paucivorans]SDM06609.1 Crotonobetainyl-CoA:carnitine CoA-transferase CaiB [Megasphaera paucivorans]
MFHPLKGVKVIDLTYFVAGPGAAKILADWGADVIKVEPPFGDPIRSSGTSLKAPVDENCNPLYDTYNANKRGLSLNLKTEEGQSILDTLLETADVFVSSYRTGALKRLGLDYETINKKYPHIIWAQLNGYGDFGPAKDNPGFDVVAFWARSGAMMDFAEKDTSPINAPYGFGDATTSCSLAGGIAAALFNKVQTGKGCKIMVSLFAQAIWNSSALVVATQYGDEYPKTRKNPMSPVMDSFKCADGNWIYISILEHERYYNTLMKDVAGRPDLVDDPRFYKFVDAKKNAPELVEIIGQAFAGHTREEMEERLKKADIAYDCIRHVKDTLTDPQALENEYIVPVMNFDGTKTKQAMTPVRFCLSEPAAADEIKPTVNCPAPKIGQDSIAILKEYGYTEEVIQQYLDKGIITRSK